MELPSRRARPRLVANARGRSWTARGLQRGGRRCSPGSSQISHLTYARASRTGPVAVPASIWYLNAMRTTIDKAGRVVIPAAARARMHLRPGTELEVLVDDVSIRLVRRVSPPKLVRRGKRLVARPTAAKLPDVDIARLIEEERNRWPG